MSLLQEIRQVSNWLIWRAVLSASATPTSHIKRPQLPSAYRQLHPVTCQNYQRRAKPTPSGVTHPPGLLNDSAFRALRQNMSTPAANSSAIRVAEDQLVSEQSLVVSPHYNTDPMELAMNSLEAVVPYGQLKTIFIHHTWTLNLSFWAVEQV
jgi:hypothetical protein